MVRAKIEINKRVLGERVYHLLIDNATKAKIEINKRVLGERVYHLLIDNGDL